MIGYKEQMVNTKMGQLTEILETPLPLQVVRKALVLVASPNSMEKDLDKKVLKVI